MGTTLDKIIRQYNREFRKSRSALLRHKGKGKAYSTYQDSLNQALSRINEAMDAYKEVGLYIKALQNLEQSNESANNLDSIQEYYERNKIVSSQTYSKILSYYRKHKGKRYYNAYKIDKKLHNFLIELGKYLEGLDRRIITSNGRIYSTAAIPHEVQNTKRLYDTLSYIAEKFMKIGGLITLAIQALYPVLSAIAIKLPSMAILLAIAGIVDVITTVMIPVGAVIHPDRTAYLKRLTRGTRVKLGLYKNIGYSIYIRYVYVLYDLLNYIMSHIKNICDYLAKNQNLSLDEMAKELTEKIEKAAGHKEKKVSLKRILTVISGLFKSGQKAEGEAKELDNIFNINGDHLTQLVALINQSPHQLGSYTYVLRFSDDAKETINAYYAGAIQISDGTLTFELNYPGGRHYKPVEVLDKSQLRIIGSNTDEEEASAILAGCMTLADELVITQIGDLRFEDGIIKIDLKKLRWLAFTKKSSWEGFLDKILKRDTKRINKDNIGFIIFESFNNLIQRRQEQSKSS
jgi:hypothetical protein